MKTYRKALVFGLLCLLYLGGPFYLIQRKQVVLQKGKIYRVTAPLMEPQQSYRGIYLPVDLPDEPQTDLTARRGEHLFVEFVQEGASVRIASIGSQRPDSDYYLRVRVRYAEQDFLLLDFPPAAQRVYMTRGEAREWSDAYAERMDAPATSETRLPVALYVYRGRGIADHLLAAGAER